MEDHPFETDTAFGTVIQNTRDRRFSLAKPKFHPLVAEVTRHYHHCTWEDPTAAIEIEITPYQSEAGTTWG
jgi:hypothetical protein